MSNNNLPMVNSYNKKTNKFIWDAREGWHDYLIPSSSLWYHRIAHFFGLKPSLGYVANCTIKVSLS